MAGKKKKAAKNKKKPEKKKQEGKEQDRQEFDDYLLTDECFRKINESNQSQLPGGDAYVSQATDTMHGLAQLRNVKTLKSHASCSRYSALPDDVTVVIPAYNEADNLTPLCERLKKMNARVVLVDDGSADRTGKVGKRFGFKVVRHLTNRGKGAAIKSGIRAANTEKIVLIDADNQHDPREINGLLEELENADVVVGNRFAGKANLPVHRSVANNLIRFLLRQKTGVNDPLCGFRAFKKNKISFDSDGFVADVEMIFNAVNNNYRISQVPVSVNYDINRKSSSKTSSVVSGVREYAKLFFYSLKWALKR